jgi:hypothetical protein
MSNAIKVLLQMQSGFLQLYIVIRVAQDSLLSNESKTSVARSALKERVGQDVL